MAFVSGFSKCKPQICSFDSRLETGRLFSLVCYTYPCFSERLRERFSDVTRAATLHSGSPSHRVVEQQLLIPGFLPEFLETSGDQENLRFLEKVATGN